MKPSLTPRARQLCTSLSALLLLSLSACGGGGGGGYNPADTPAAGGATVGDGSSSSTTPASVPTISVAPADQSLTAGQSASFSVTATGTSLSYQWQVSTDGGATYVDLNGATNATYVISSVALADTGSRYQVKVSNAGGTATSASALLSVQAAAAEPKILTQPIAVNVVEKTSATFAVEASGTPAPGYQWQVSTDGGQTFVDIGGANAATYTLASPSTADNGKVYRVHVSNSVSAVDSNTATLTVKAAAAAPAITQAPVDLSVTAGSGATFSVVASGTPTPTYQWQVSTDAGATFTNITGATTANYTTPATTATDTGKYFRVVLTNSQGTVNSTKVKLTVNAAATTLGSASKCYVAPVAGTVYTMVTVDGNNSQSTLTLKFNGSKTFEGHTANEIEINPNGNTFKYYESFDATKGWLTSYGQLYSEVSGGTTTSSLSIDTPAFVDQRYTLAPGASITQSNTVVSTPTTTINGQSVSAAAFTSTFTSTVTYGGQETITVPAGTYKTCKFTEASTTSSGKITSTSWQLMGSPGIEVKSSRILTDGSTQTTTLQSLTVTP